MGFVSCEPYVALTILYPVCKKKNFVERPLFNFIKSIIYFGPGYIGAAPRQSTVDNYTIINIKIKSELSVRGEQIWVQNNPIRLWVNHIGKNITQTCDPIRSNQIQTNSDRIENLRLFLL